MKRMILVALVILLPLILFAGNGNLLNIIKKAMLTMPEQRGYRKTQYINYSKEMTDWILTGKTVYYYSSIPSQPDSLVVFGYFDNEYTANMACNIQYNAAGKRTQVDQFFLEPSMGRIPFGKILATYDAQNRLTHVYNYAMDFMSMELIPSSRYHFFYVNNNISSSYGWESDPWGSDIPGYFKDNYGLDGQGRVTSGITQMSSDSLNWNYTDSYEATYHANDTSNAASTIEMISSFYTMPWLDAGLYFPGMPLTNLSFTWNGTVWEQDMRSTYDWNPANNHLNYILDENWNGAWVPDYKTIPTYDVNGNVSEILYQSNFLRPLDDSEKLVFTWEQYSATDDPIASPLVNLEVRTYPQPFADDLHILSSSKLGGEIKLDIYNVKGQIINSLNAFSGTDITWNGMDTHGRKAGSGIYFIRASQNGLSKTTRAIKLK